MKSRDVFLNNGRQSGKSLQKIKDEIIVEKRAEDDISAVAIQEEAEEILDNLKKQEYQKERNTGKIGNKENEEEITRRFIDDRTNYHWPQAVIPYQFFSGIDDEEMEKYQCAMRKFEYWSCFRFPEWNSAIPEEVGHGTYLEFVQSSSCSSYIGREKSDAQAIKCCNNEKKCIHELSHAIGFFHEHSHPARDDYIRINWDNIDPDRHSLFTRMGTQAGTSLGYDIGSIMHYSSRAFSENKLDSITVLDADLEHIWLENDDAYHYLFKEAQTMYNCNDLKCPNFNGSFCENDGYFAYIKGECTCKCLPGLDPENGCATLYTPDTSLKNLVWPDGTYSLLKVKGQDCPTGFSTGFSTMRSRLDLETSKGQHFGSVEDGTIVQEFCSKTTPSVSGSAASWEAGSYCIYRRDGECPKDFESIDITYDGKDPPETCAFDGELPDGSYGNEVTLTLCCRSDADIGDPITLPTSKPFVLFQKSPNGCQEVVDMVVSEESYMFRHYPSMDHSGNNYLLPYITKISYSRRLYHMCYYAPLKVGNGCGMIASLTESESEVTISSPNYPEDYNENEICTYLIKSPVGTKIKLNFHDFDLEGADNECYDSLEVRMNRPGQSDVRYCGLGFSRSLVTRDNYLMLTLRTDFSENRGGFTATASLQKMDADNLCYRTEDKGLTYRGTVNYTRQFRTCVPWSEVLNCSHHPFQVGDYDDGLESNYCRNPGQGTQPWCYYDAELCLRDYCDVCGLETCFDIADNCATLLDNDPNFCGKDKDLDSMRICAFTCDRCTSLASIPTVSEMHCDRPHQPDAILEGTPKISYDVGDEVTFHCWGGKSLQKMRCLGDGTWSGGAFTCGVCPSGFSSFGSSCYIAVDTHATKSEAEDHCASYNAVVSPAKTTEEAGFIHSLVKFRRSYWIALTDKSSEGTFVWDDGDTLFPSQETWNSGQPDNRGNEDCVKVVYKSKKWKDEPCEGEHHSFICKLDIVPTRMCDDRNPSCQTAISHVPDACSRFPQFAQQQCRASCTNCTNRVCDVPQAPYNAVQVPGEVVIMIGDFLEYECENGYVHVTGNLLRACLESGMLSGSPPVCADESTVETANNAVLLRNRAKIGDLTRVAMNNNGDMRIHKDGFITKWSFYSNYNGSVSLQVYEPSTETPGYYRLVGQNVIRSTMDDQIYTVEIALADDRIQVQEGQLIAIHYMKDGGGIPYDRCDEATYSEAGGVLKSNKAFQDVMDVGTDVEFREPSSHGDCRIYSLKAYVGP
ncbi:hypothetical protein ScPMuIL_003380 [Solemya velum]